MCQWEESKWNLMDWGGAGYGSFCKSWGGGRRNRDGTGCRSKRETHCYVQQHYVKWVFRACIFRPVAQSAFGSHSTVSKSVASELPGEYTCALTKPLRQFYFLRRAPENGAAILPWSNVFAIFHLDPPCKVAMRIKWLARHPSANNWNT